MKSFISWYLKVTREDTTPMDSFISPVPYVTDIGEKTNDKDVLKSGCRTMRNGGADVKSIAIDGSER